MINKKLERLIKTKTRLTRTMTLRSSKMMLKNKMILRIIKNRLIRQIRPMHWVKLIKMTLSFWMLLNKTKMTTMMTRKTMTISWSLRMTMQPKNQVMKTRNKSQMMSILKMVMNKQLPKKLKLLKRPLYSSRMLSKRTQLQII